MPTKLVRDGSTEGYDPTPVYDLTPPHALPSPAVDGSAHRRRPGVVRTIVELIAAAVTR